jgi:hypothetical protein
MPCVIPIDAVVILGAFAVLVGALSAVGGLIKLLRLAQFQSGTEWTVGRVVGIESDRNRTDPTFAPVVQYQVAERTYKTRGAFISPLWYRVGQRVTVKYFAGCPEKAQILTWQEWFAAWLGLVLGILFCLGGILAMMFMRTAG